MRKVVDDILGYPVEISVGKGNGRVRDPSNKERMRLRLWLRLRLKLRLSSSQGQGPVRQVKQVKVEVEFEVKGKDKDGSDDPGHHSSTYQRLPKSSKISIGDKTWTGPHGFISNPQGDGETKELAWREVQGRGEG